jgi:hypothetical protein
MANGDSFVEFRLKAKRRDGSELPYVRHDGTKATAKRITVATVFNRDGRRGIQFEPSIAAAVAKALGSADAKDFYFDMYEQDGGAPKAKSDAPRTDDF